MSAVNLLYYVPLQIRGRIIMIKREMYMKRIRPFIGTELIKVMTGIRRCGKSVMLELIKEEFSESGISPEQFVSINFEDLNYTHLQTAKAQHNEILHLNAMSYFLSVRFINRFHTAMKQYNRKML